MSETSRVPITHYNGHTFKNLSYDTDLKLIYYKERETPWSITTITTNSKRTNEKKSYIYESVVIPDAQNIKRKIVKNKLEKIITLTSRKKIESDEPKTDAIIDNDINKQLAAFREQKEKEENELIENYFKTHSTDGGQLIKLNGNSWFIK
jgi:IMP dehydrogenase/GMP reductase